MNNAGLLVLRVGIGLMMIFPHGWDKMINFSSKSTMFPNILGLGSSFSLGLAVFAEVVCQLMIILGVKTRFFAIPALATMLVAAFIVHSGDSWFQKEKAVLYALVYIVLIISNGGKYSIRK